MIFFQKFYLDREKDIVVDLYMDGDRLFYIIRTPNYRTGNLIVNLARLCRLETSLDENGLKVIRGEVTMGIMNRCIFCVWGIRRSRIFSRTAGWN